MSGGDSDGEAWWVSLYQSGWQLSGLVFQRSIGEGGDGLRVRGLCGCCSAQRGAVNDHSTLLLACSCGDSCESCLHPFWQHCLLRCYTPRSWPCVFVDECAKVMKILLKNI